MKCQICLRQFTNLKFATGRISICKTCVDDLNDYHAVGDYAVTVFRGRLEKGIVARLERDMSDKGDREKQLRAMKEYNKLEEVVNAALPQWLNKMASENVSSKEHKMLRAQRRGLLHSDRPKHWGYPPSWPKIAKDLRKLDKHACFTCKSEDSEIHVHHILYKSHFGTNRKENLISLCKRCHENEHGRELDVYEENDSSSATTEDQEMRPKSFSRFAEQSSSVNNMQSSDFHIPPFDKEGFSSNANYILPANSYGHNTSAATIDKSAPSPAAPREMESIASLKFEDKQSQSNLHSTIQLASPPPFSNQSSFTTRVIDFFIRLFR